MSKLKKWFKENISTTDLIAIIILLLAVIGIFYLPHWVTQKSWKYDLGETESNEIADTIGGILGPFISFISAILVYLALREQVKANRLIQKQLNNEENERFEKEIYEEVLNSFRIEKEKLEKFFARPEYEGFVRRGEDASLDIIDQIIFGVTNNNYQSEDELTIIEIIKNINASFKIFNDNILQNNQFKIIIYLRHKELTNFLIPNRVKKITDFKFQYHYKFDVQIIANWIQLNNDQHKLYEKVKYKLSSEKLDFSYLSNLNKYFKESSDNFLKEHPNKPF